MDQERIHSYVRIPPPFPIESHTGLDIMERGLTAYDWPWWQRDDGRIVVREFLTRLHTIVAVENELG